MDVEAVRRFVDRSESIIESSPEMDEETTKLRVVQPFIELLGWDPHTPEVKPEYPVEMGTRTFYVDYALLIGETPVVFVEAKACSESITEDHVRQLQSYMRQTLKVEWGVITNGRRFDVLSKAPDADTEGEITIGSFELPELAERPGPLRIVSRDAIESGKADEIVRQVAAATAAIDRLETTDGAVAERVAEVLRDELGSEIPLDHSGLAAEFIGTVRDRLRERRADIAGLADGPDDPDNPTRLTEFAADPNAKHTEHGGTYVIEFTDGDTLVTAFSADRQSDVMVAAVGYLIEEHQLIDRLDGLPYVPSQEKAIINDEPEYEHASHAYKELPDGYYLDTKLARGAKKHEIEQLAAKCGLEVRFDGEW